MGHEFSYIERFQEKPGFKHYKANIDGQTVLITRWANWRTEVYWTQPEEQSNAKFLEAVELVFQDAESSGYDFTYPPILGAASKRYIGVDEYEITRRPLRPSGVEELTGQAIDDILYLRITAPGLPQLRLHGWNRNVMAVFENEKPRETRGALVFMSEMLEFQPKLTPQEIGGFVLSLPF